MCQGMKAACVAVGEKEDKQWRRRRAAQTWWCELFALVLTVVYLAILDHDTARDDAEDRLSSPSWFKWGFCVAEYFDGAVDSHTLCVIADLLVGAWLARANWKRYQLDPRSSLKVAMTVSAFTIMHGLGHLFIGQLFRAGMYEWPETKPSQNPVLVTAAIMAGYLIFLSMAPYLGYCSGVHPAICVLVHVASSLIYLEFFPAQFSFAWVLLYLNVWYCAPRVMLIGSSRPRHIALRVDEGWDVASFGFLALMPVVFAEMLTCDMFVKGLSGHFLYDLSIQVAAVVYCKSLWSKDEK